MIDFIPQFKAGKFRLCILKTLAKCPDFPGLYSYLRPHLRSFLTGVDDEHLYFALRIVAALAPQLETTVVLEWLDTLQRTFAQHDNAALRGEPHLRRSAHSSSGCSHF